MTPLVQRVVAAFGAHSFGQVINIVIQLASLPLFLTRWSAETYGMWLLLSAMPSYLTMADGGLVTAAANKLAMAYARGDIQESNCVFQSTLFFILVTCSAAWLAVASIVFLIELPGVQSQDQKLALLSLASGVLIAQFNGLTEAIFRASGKHAQGIMLGNLSRLLEWAGWMIGLFAIGTFSGVAICGLGMRFAGLLLTIHLSWRLHAGISWGLKHASSDEVKLLVRPAMSFMAFPLSNALSIQGTTLLVGHLLGPVAVTIFNTYRTISRVALQVTGTLGNSLWAEFSRLYATGGAQALESVYQRTFRLGAAGSVVMSVALATAAPHLLASWSRNKIAYDWSLMMIMLTYATIGGLWNVSRTLLMSINNHTNLSKIAIGSAIASLVVCYPLGSFFGLNGIALGILFIELAMATLCITLARDFFIGLPKHD